ncbi:CotY/CotZ family spore coat protein [Sporosarcina trichiuri]|uniref:CotY/CotZ family spore coat protein n=1 Tax=Sporosarcina trichiuri TaxID=3056445 RepID=UPI0025B40237|nr:CotY/CotZ family spore coat protein [Sporosarcina sp. 0.2-SM1T-5]WJY28922.1 CotY/CotZ family spore coat protein [Sporosarcina sp. 0.2-SM1T-5]
MSCGCGKNENQGDKVSPTHGHCVCEAVRFIKRLQDTHQDDDCFDCDTDCFMRPLGSLVSPANERFNTRVFSLLTEDGDFFKAMYRPATVTPAGSRSGTVTPPNTCFSVFFRVQNIFDDCCATLMVLEPRDANGPVNLFDCGKLCLDRLCPVTEFRATKSCITVDLNCFCAIQCITDTYVTQCPPATT